jgi:hypothetical protein
MTKANFDKLVKGTSSPYLASPKGGWTDADGKTWDISTMPPDYRDNCKKTIKKDKKNVEHDIYLEGVDFDKKDLPDIRRYAKKAYKQVDHDLNTL